MREDSQTVGTMHSCSPIAHLAAVHESAMAQTVRSALPLGPPPHPCTKPLRTYH
jgi:hypothetical protein